MKKLYLIIALAGVLSAPSLQAALEGTVNISNAPGFGDGTGGAFNLTVTSLSGVNSAAVNAIVGQGNPFFSFCLEKNEYITLPGNYSVTVDNVAIDGGSGPILPDPISLATAWLYSQFRAGTLTASVSAFGVWAQNDAGGNALQDAIWYLENEQDTGNNYLVSAAKNALSLDNTTVRTTAANGSYNVRVLNLYTVNGEGNTVTPFNQSQLAMVPEPSTYIAGALLMIPVLVQVRRWKRSA